MRLTIIQDFADEAAWTHIETDDVTSALMLHFGDELPATARLYAEECVESNDVTPASPEGVEFLNALKCDQIYCVVYPGEPFSGAFLILAIVIAAAVLLKPKLPSAALASQSPQSPNNDLGSRGNVPRLNGRIPDIFGEVKAFPDLISVPYSIFDSQIEIETINFCIGRGEYSISDVRDGDTLAAQIQDMSVKFYGPGKNATITSTPDVQIGSYIYEPIYQVQRSNSVNGQTLNPPNSGNYAGVIFYGDYGTPGELGFPTGSGVVDLFVAGDIVNLSSPSWVDSGTGHTIAISNTYTVSYVGTDFLELSNPAAVDADWNFISVPHLAAGSSITKAGDQWLGPFDIDNFDIQELWFNFVAPQGLYKSDGSTQQSVSPTIRIEVQRISTSGVPIGGPTNYDRIIYGSYTLTGSRRQTVKIGALSSGRYRVRVRRLTNHDYAFSGTLADEIQWRDLYGVQPISVDYGNVTTGQARVVGTKSALAVKERKLNMIAQRKIKTRSPVAPYPYNVGIVGTNNAADIIDHVVQDPFLGGRPLAELDVTNLYSTMADVRFYFGTSDAAEFSATLDSLDMTFEDTLATIADAVFLTAFRQGRQFRFNFRKKETASKLLFNGRNVTPGSMSIKSKFGREKAYDGIEYNYVDRLDGTTATLYIPADRSATNPNSIESVGIRSSRQAWFHAYRAWNELRYRYKLAQFEALSESELLITNDRIMVADLVRANTDAGEVVSVSGLNLTLSEPVNIPGGAAYTIFLQLANGVLQALPVSQGANPYTVILGAAPSVALVTADDRKVKTLYTITANSSLRTDIYLTTEREHQGGMVSRIAAMNYDDRYYDNDKDYINGVIL